MSKMTGKIGPEWVPCVKLPVIVHVREQRTGEKHVSTREGLTPVKPDDLIMRGVAGEEYPIGRELWEMTYTTDTAPQPAATEPLLQRIAEFVTALDEEMVVSHLGVFNPGDDPKKAVKDLMLWSQGVGEYFAGEKAKERVAELEQRNSDLHEDVQRFKKHALNEKAARLELERQLEEARKDAERWDHACKGNHKNINVCAWDADSYEFVGYAMKKEAIDAIADAEIAAMQKGQS